LKSVEEHDILLVHLEELDYTDKVVPIKLYEYLMLPKPIIGILPKNSYDPEIIIKSKSGVVFSPKENLETFY